MIVTYKDEQHELSPEQVEEIESAKKKPIVFDDDCKELSPEMINSFKCAAKLRNRQKKNA